MALYAIIQDAHHNIEYLRRAINVCRNNEVDAVFANGDILEPKGDLYQTMQHSMNVFDALANLNSEIFLGGPRNIKTYVQTGSHEPVSLFNYIMGIYSSKYPNIINATEEKAIRAKDHDIVFLSGSDWTSGGEHILGKDLKTGLYSIKGKKTAKYDPLKDIDRYNKDKANGKVHGMISYQNMADLKKRVRNPEKTVVVCHIPPKFNNVDTCIDMAYFAQKADGSLVPGNVLEGYIKNQFGNLTPEQMQQIANANGFTFKRENRGNEALRKMYEELGIDKAVSGHFHESTHRSNDWKGKPVKEGKWTKELFWNAGHLDEGHFGILEVKGDKVKYWNMKLK